MLNIPIILGTARENRYSDKVALYILNQTKNLKIKSEIIDVRDYKESKTTPSWIPNKKIEPFRNKLKQADSIIIISPEYNHGYPGELKIFFDGLYEEFKRKPVGICGVSSGGIGGARVVEQLRLVVIAAQMVPISNALYFTNVEELFEESGQIKDPNYNNRFTKFIDELIWYTKVLKLGRENKS